MSGAWDKNWEPMVPNRPAERRVYPRQRPAADITLPVEFHTYDRQDARVDLKGNVLNISRGGVLVRISEPLVVGTGCLVHFPLSGNWITPAYGIGRVVRCDTSSGELTVAVEFEAPLDSVSL